MKIPYELIAKHLRNEALPDEIRQVEAWINDSPRHARIVESLRREWKYINEQSQPVIPDKEETWKHILNRTKDSSQPSTPYSRRALLQIVSIAACIALLFGIGATLLYQRGADESVSHSITEIRNPKGQKTQVFLPDGTNVWLNSNSSLTYASNFNTKDRQVKLTGEAFFDVSHNPDKQFTVSIDNVDVQVHGTSFNVSSYEKDPEVRVSLLEGQVSLASHSSGDEIGVLSPNTMAVITKADLSCRIVPDDAEATSLWTKQILRIYNEDMAQVVKKLGHWYGVNIHLQRPEMTYRYTFTVKTETLRELLQMLNKITPIEYRIDGEEVLIK